MLQGMLDLLTFTVAAARSLKRLGNNATHPARFGRYLVRYTRLAPPGAPPAGSPKAAEWGSSENTPRAKFYLLTAAGKKQLDKEWKTWKRFSGAVELILRDA